MNHLPYAFRKLRQRPGFTLLITLTLAIGIAAATVVFGVADALLLRPLPYRGVDRLLVGYTAASGHEQTEHGAVSFPDFEDWRRESRSLAGIAAFSDTSDLTLTGGQEPERVRACFVSTSYFDLLGVRPMLGRAFLPEEGLSAGSMPRLIMTYSLWRLRFGGDPAVIGKTVRLGEVPYTVIGVLPRDFREFSPSAPPEVYVPVTMASRAFVPAYLTRRGHRWLNVLARLRPGTPLSQARQEARALAERLSHDFPNTNLGVRLGLVPLADFAFGFRDVPRIALVLALGALFVLLIGCVNVANLQLVGAAIRRREMAIQLALGAPRRRLAAQLLVEVLLLVSIAGVAGILLSAWGLRAMVTLSPLPLPPAVEVGIDSRVLLAALTVSLVTALAVASAPVLKILRADLRTTLQESGRQMGAAGWGLSRRLLVIVEVATALTLLIGAGLMIRSFLSLHDSGLGFRTDHLLTAQLRLSDSKYSSPDSKRAFYQRLLEQASGLPGVRKAYLWGPGNAGASEFFRDVIIEGRSRVMADRCRLFEHRVSAGTLQGVEIPLIRGRYLGPEDGASAPPTAVLSASAAKACWPGQDPIGKRFQRSDEPGASWITVVGLVQDAKHRGRDPRQSSPTDVYYPLPQVPTTVLSLLVYTGQDSETLAPALRRKIRALDPELPLFDIATLDERMRGEENENRFYALLMGIYAAAALILAITGIYSVLAYSVAQRTQEIGIRMSLGARAADIMRLVGGQILSLVAAGLVAGVAGAVAMGRVMSNLLFGVGKTDLLTFSLASLGFLLAALLACYVPTRRATRVDPKVAISYE